MSAGLVSIHRQRGVALLSVLFVVVVLTALVSQLLTLGWRDLERTQWLQDQAQAYQYALGGEQLARQILHADGQALREEGINISPVPPPPARYHPDRGEIRLQITDLQGRLNLNNAQRTDQQGLVGRFFSQALQQPQLVAPLTDWVDSDTLPRPGGQEDNHYLSQPQPYRGGNRLMSHWSELNMLDSNINSDMLRSASSWLTTLPRPTPLNINTLSGEIASIIHPGLSAAQLDAARMQGPFPAINAFLQDPTTAGLEINTTALTVNSEFFQATVLATRGEFQQPLVSRFFFSNGEIDLLDRSPLIGTAARQKLQGYKEFQDETDTAF